MKVSAWTKKVFAPVFSSSNTPTATTTTPFHSVSNPIGHAKENGSIHSNISSSLLNAKRRMRLFGSADGSSSSIMNAIFSLNRDRSSSCPDIHQTEANGGNDEKKKNDNGDGEEEKPTTTTIYYYPPDESQLERAQTPDNTSRPVEPDHEVWYLRHIGRIPAASVSSPDVSHLHHCLHQHQYHDKECEHVRRAAHNPKQRYTHCSPSPASFPVEGFRSRADSAPSILPSHGLLESNTTTTDSSSSSPVIYSQPRISSKTLVVVTPPPPFAAPPSFQVRRSSLTNEKNDRSTSRFPRHSVDTIRRLRDSIMGMAKLGSASFSSSFHPVVSPTIHITIATKSPPSSNDALEPCAIPACPHNTPVVSGALELPATSTTTSTTTTTRTTAPDPSYEQLIQMVDSLSREVEAMKRQRPYYNNHSSNRSSLTSSSYGGSSISLSSDTTLSSQYSRNSRSSATLSPAVTSSPRIFATNSKASLSMSSLLLPNNNSNNNNNNANANRPFTPPPPSSPPPPPHPLSSSNVLLRNGGGNKLHHHRLSHLQTRFQVQDLPPPPSEQLPCPPGGDTIYNESNPHSLFTLSPQPRHAGSLLALSTLLFPTPPATHPFSPTPIPTITVNGTNLTSPSYDSNSVTNNKNKNINRGDLPLSYIYTPPPSSGPTPTLPSTVARPLPTTPSPLSRQVRVSSPISFSSSSSSPSPPTPPMSPEDTLPPLPPLRPYQRSYPTTPSIILSSTFEQPPEETSLSSSNTNIRITIQPPSPPTTSSLTSPSTPNVATTGTPKRPPRPPQSSMDIQQVLSLIDSRLGTSNTVSGSGNSGSRSNNNNAKIGFQSESVVSLFVTAPIIPASSSSSSTSCKEGLVVVAPTTSTTGLSSLDQELDSMVNQFQTDIANPPLSPPSHQQQQHPVIV